MKPYCRRLPRRRRDANAGRSTKQALSDIRFCFSVSEGEFGASGSRIIHQRNFLTCVFFKSHTKEADPDAKKGTKEPFSDRFFEGDVAKGLFGAAEVSNRRLRHTPLATGAEPGICDMHLSLRVPNRAPVAGTIGCRPCCPANSRDAGTCGTVGAVGTRQLGQLGRIEWDGRDRIGGMDGRDRMAGAASSLRA
ncbi:hypothetical protein C811_02165 [Adlercreutzia caecimuris B7]|uniref:Uncharacterized protein n=1 Tax=Adlercreutzia caecimuris B7 TaxID=1235794 RepID=R9KT43_9ACTN|nr:hypothetical protein C811_02165 [Adlercreutzia caecimuris B7]